MKSVNNEQMNEPPNNPKMGIYIYLKIKNHMVYVLRMLREFLVWLL
jgi:hypothetical protein